MGLVWGLVFFCHRRLQHKDGKEAKPGEEEGFVRYRQPGAGEGRAEPGAALLVRVRGAERNLVYGGSLDFWGGGGGLGGESNSQGNHSVFSGGLQAESGENFMINNNTHNKNQNHHSALVFILRRRVTPPEKSRPSGAAAAGHEMPAGGQRRAPAPPTPRHLLAHRRRGGDTRVPREPSGQRRRGGRGTPPAAAGHWRGGGSGLLETHPPPPGLPSGWSPGWLQGREVLESSGSVWETKGERLGGGGDLGEGGRWRKERGQRKTPGLGVP